MKPKSDTPSRRSWNASWTYVEELARVMRERGKDLIDLAKLEAGPFEPGEAGMPRGKGPSDPTASEAVRRLSGEMPKDEVAEWLGALFAATKLIRGEASRCERMVYLVDHRADERAGRQVTGAHCANCRRYVAGSPRDRLKAQRCSECDAKWRRWRQAETDAGRTPSDVVFHQQHGSGEYLADPVGDCRCATCFVLR